MQTWIDKTGIRHELSHVNDERLAARTACGHYHDFRSGEVEGDATVTCIDCLAAPPLMASGEVNAKLFVGMRAGDRVRHCRNHLMLTHEDGRCLDCGYARKRDEGWHE